MQNTLQNIYITTYIYNIATKNKFFFDIQTEKNTKSFVPNLTEVIFYFVFRKLKTKGKAIASVFNDLHRFKECPSRLRKKKKNRRRGMTLNSTIDNLVILIQVSHKYLKVGCKILDLRCFRQFWIRLCQLRKPIQQPQHSIFL